MDLAEEAYCATAGFPSDEKYGLTSQIRRSASSIPANIAEGYGRHSPKSFVYFLKIAMGSLHELETHIYLAQRFNLLLPEQSSTILDQTEELAKMLYGFTRNVQSKM